MSWLPSWTAFLATIDTGSMASAGRKLGTTRAQISKQIAELEALMGSRLLERSTRRLTLTPAGDVFAQHARRTLQTIDQAETAVRNLGDQPRGVLRIAATMTFGCVQIAPLIPELLQRHPELRCELRLSDQVVDLLDDDIDVALRMTRSLSDDLIAKPLLDLRRMICASPSYLRDRARPQTPADLQAHACFSYLLGEDRIWHLRDPQGREHRLAVQHPFETTSLDVLYNACLAGLGLAILPAYLCAPAVADGRLVTVLNDYQPQVRFGSTVYACYAPSRRRSPKVQALLALIEQRWLPVPPWEQLLA